MTRQRDAAREALADRSPRQRDALETVRSRELQCPKCGAMDVPRASPTLEVQDGTVGCTQCSYSWRPR